MDGKQLWQTTLGQMEVSMSKANFTTWLKSTNYLEYNDDVLSIGVANVFTKEWLEKKYHENILQTCRKIHPSVKNIIYKVSSVIKPKDINPDKNISKTIEDKLTYEKPSRNYNFDNFVVGNNNRLAHAAAMAAAKNPGKAYNPLFLSVSLHI